MEDQAKKMALLDLANSLEKRREQFGKDWRTDLYNTVSGWQDKLTSDPNDTVAGPAAATALGLGLNTLVADPSQDSTFSGGAPMPPSMRGVGKAIPTAVEAATAEAKALKALTNTLGDKMPKSLSASEAKAIVDKFAAGDAKGATEMIQAGIKRDAQLGMARDVVTSEAGSSAVQPTPKFTEPATPKPVKKQPWMDKKYGWDK